MKPTTEAERRIIVLNYMRQEKAATIREIRQLIECGFTTAARLLNNLVIDGELSRKTKSFNGRDYYIYIYEKAAAPEIKPDVFKFFFLD